MNYMLDTNICIYLINKQPSTVTARFNQHSVGEILVSSITVAELAFGVQKSHRRTQNEAALQQFLFPLVIREFDADAAFSYGQIRAELERRGTPIGSLDTLIAGHALSLETTLVTNNLREFSRVPNLLAEDWT